ncbi:hypothetical protein F2Q70_00043046 [Brassica cretica]|uniref:Uncharacterized protein n=1 Tax=Brassica cretica TaxID=69181 RepID=A0A8S9KK47_BRACR|nr:hypothetical protein F2Q70_00043046 [Brassica cretica]
MEEMRHNIARIQRVTDVSRPTSIDRHRPASIDSRLPASIDNRLPASVDDNLPHSHMMKFQLDFHTRAEKDQLGNLSGISWLTTCMEEMRHNIARIQRATDVSRPTSIDRHRPASIDNRLPASIDNRLPASVDDNLPHSHMMKFQPDFHTRAEKDQLGNLSGISWLTTCMEEMRHNIAIIQRATDVSCPTSIDKTSTSLNRQVEKDQLVEGVYRALETTEERLDGRCDDIYFPMDLSISALTSKIEAIQRDLAEIQSYIARRQEASASIDRRNNKSTDIHRQTSIDRHS